MRIGVAKETKPQEYAAWRRSRSSSHSPGRYKRQSTGQLTTEVAALIETPTWQLPTFPRAPQYWCAILAEWRPNFGKPVSSTIHASGSTAADSLRASLAHSTNGVCHSLK